MDWQNLTLSQAELCMVLGTLQEPHMDPAITYSHLLLEAKLNSFISANSTMSEPNSYVTLSVSFAP